MAIVFFIGIFFAGIIERAEKIHDPRFVVIDEAVGMMIATFLLDQIWWQWVVAFFLFRFFDVVKLWPASKFDQQKGGFCLMMDDVVAGGYCFMILLIILIR